MNLKKYIYKNLRKIIATLIVVGLVITGSLLIPQNNKQLNNDDKLSVLASYYPLYDFAKNIGGDRANVTNITPAGLEPHDYEPSARDIVDALESDVFIYNGGNMEPWANDFLLDYKNTVVKSNNGIEMLYAQDDDRGNEQDHEDQDGLALDPHFWLDPVLAQKVVDNILEGLVSADPGNQAYYANNANIYKQKLTDLDNDIKLGVNSCRIRTIISSHEAFNYYGKRYNINILSIAGISPDIEPSVATMAEITGLVKEQGIGYIFFESLVSSRLAETIANETGAKTLVFDPIEGLTDEALLQGKDYISVQKENLANIRTALACQ